MIETAPDTMCLSTDGLPDGWSPARVGDMVDLVNGFAFKPSHWKGRGLPIIRIQNLNNSDAPFNYCPDSMPDKYLVATNDLLFAWSGTPGTSFGAHVWKGPMGLLNQHIFRVDFNENLLDKHFVRLAINHNLDDYIAQAHGGVGLAHITKSKFETSLLSLPPLAEQKRIVRKVEECLAQVNSARKRLSRVPAILKRFRQAVLAAACSGKLTEDWREATLGQSTSPSIANPAEEESVPNLPESWRWTPMGEVSEIRGGIQKQPKRAPKKNAFPYLRVANVLRGRLDLAEIQKMELFEGELQSYRLERGDLLVVEGNGSITEIGRSAIWDGSIDNCVHQNHIIRVRLRQCIPEYADAFWNSPLGTGIVSSRAVTTSGLYSLSTKKVGSIPIPLPPREEQEEIVRRVSALLKVADGVNKRLAAASLTSDKLTQSILAKAFRGELVPTEAELARREGREYEPASVLLERIKEERASRDQVLKRRARRHPKNGNG